MRSTSPKDIRAYRPAGFQKRNVFLHCPVVKAAFRPQANSRSTRIIWSRHTKLARQTHNQLFAAIPQAVMRRLPRSERALDGAEAEFNFHADADFHALGLQDYQILRRAPSTCAPRPTPLLRSIEPDCQQAPVAFLSLDNPSHPG